MSNLEGVMLSDYLLLECISQGSVADVYRARQNDASQYEVAVKIFRPGYAEREAFRSYFMYEAEKIGQFDHPHILPFIEYGEGEGLLYAVTPFVKSGTLEDLLKKVGGKFSAMQALPIVQQLCDAVQYAHERDVIHGNIKPANVFVANDGRMLLADFGIVRAYADDQQSLTHMEWGTTEYAAPEQSLGLLRRASDIYTLGALFFRLLTGTPIFTGQTPVEVLLKHVRQEPPSARTLDASISDAVNEVLRKALSKRSEERYQSASELSQTFATAVAFAPVASPVARSLNLATRPLNSSQLEPQMPLSPSARVAVPPMASSVSFQYSQAPVLAFPPELQQSEPQPPVLPEQHGDALQAFSEQRTAPIPDQMRDASAHSSRLVGPVEWSPIAQTGADDGLSNTAAGYLRRQAQVPLAPEPQPGAGQLQKSQDGERRKRSLLLPILVVILLLLGLLGALVSSFLFPAPSGGSDIRNPPALVVYQASLTWL
jgi:serine/threonine protein kinase